MKPFRISVIIDEFDHDGFWSVYSQVQITKTKLQLTESLSLFYARAIQYIDEQID